MSENTIPASEVLAHYRQHVAEREKQGVVPQPLNVEQVTAVVELIEQAPRDYRQIPISMAKNLRSQLCVCFSVLLSTTIDTLKISTRHRTKHI
jgi:hypothetical protein